MPIFFPDNEKRKERLIELGTDAEDYLQESVSDYQSFQTLLKEVNKQIADVYQAAGLKPPSTRSVDILEQAGVANTGTGDAIVNIAEILADITGFIGTVKYLAPAATRALVETGAMSAETAAKVLTRFTVPLVGREVTITAGDIAGNVLGGIVGGIAVAGVDLGIDAIEGAILKGKLIGAIDSIFPMRTTTRIAQLQSKTLVDSLTAIKTTLDALDGAGVTITDAIIRNLTTKDAQPSIEAEKKITVATVLAELKKYDQSRNSYTTDDPT